MRLTRYSDFCFRVLIHVGLKDGTLSTTREISDRFGISSNHLMKVVYDLNIKGYLETVRGKNGGIRLGRRPESINLGTLLRDIEDDMALVECHADERVCRIGPACRLRGVVAESLRAFLAVFDRYTLADLLEPQQEILHLLDIEPAASLPARRVVR